MAKHKKQKKQQANGKAQRPPIETTVAAPLIESLIGEAEDKSPEVQEWLEKYGETMQLLEAAGAWGIGDKLSMMVWAGIEAHSRYIFRRALELRQDPAELLNIKDTSA